LPVQNKFLFTANEISIKQKTVLDVTGSNEAV